MRILNMTQHEATPDQIIAGVVQPVKDDHERIKSIITFHELPDLNTLRNRAVLFAALASELLKKYGCDAVMIGGAPYFAAEQERALSSAGIPFCYAFSKRESEERTNPDGSVTKSQVFRHAGFVWKEVR